MSLPTLDESRKYIIDNLSSENEKNIHAQLTKNFPDKIKKRYWPKGFRFPKLSSTLFKRGLLSAFAKDESIQYFLMMRALPPIQISPIQSAFIWWEFDQLNGLGEEAYRWLSVRFQPEVENLIVYQTDILNVTNFKYQDIEKTEEGCSVICQNNYDFNCIDLLKHISNNLIETALEFMIPIKNVNDDILDNIHKTKYIDAAKILAESDDYKAISMASICLFAAKQFDESITLISKSIFKNSELKTAHILALKALIALETSNNDKCLSLVQEAKHDDEKLFNWPTWSLLEGLAYHNSNQFDKAALAFLFNGGGDRRYSLLPMQLALATLEVGRLDIPETLKELVRQKYATPSNRLHAEKELQSLYGKLHESIPKPSLQKSRQKLSYTPNASNQLAVMAVVNKAPNAR